MGLSWFRNLFRRKKKEVKLTPEKQEHLKKVYIPRNLPKPGSQIIKKGYGKHFEGKGRHQHKQYRQSIKARTQPEED